MTRIDKILEKLMTKEVPDNEVAVLLSGGVDSLSVAFTAHRLGKKVHAYTFHLKDNPTYDSDKAQEASKIFGWKIDVIEVPVHNLERDFFTLLNKYHCKKKTHFECAFPFIYVYPKIKEKYVLTGMGFDDFYGLTKRCAIHFKTPKEKFDEYRMKTHFQPNNDGMDQHLYMCQEHNKILVSIGMQHQDVVDFFMKFDWYEMNKPFQKHHIRTAYSKEFTKIGKVKQHSNLQLVANIPALFETLFDNKKINFKNRKRTMDICRDWNKSW